MTTSKRETIRLGDEGKPAIPVAEKLMWDLADLVAVTGLSRSALVRLRDRGELPKPVDIGVGRVCWAAESIRKWIVARAS
ncbi:MAG: AlpA family phage regulatory protein [Planctomycetes bacterium]|nr:AlpA family phage regulatory protein [Planctomycetota bacterium]